MISDNQFRVWVSSFKQLKLIDHLCANNMDIALHYYTTLYIGMITDGK